MRFPPARSSRSAMEPAIDWISPGSINKSPDWTLACASAGTSFFGGAIGDGPKKLNLTVAAGTLALTNAATLNLTRSTVTVNGGGAVLELDFTGTNQVSAVVLNGINQTPGVYSSANASPYLAGTGSL